MFFFFVAGVKSDKLVLGLGYYGRSFTLESSSCKEVGCKFSGPGKAGPCTKSPGILAWFEIDKIIAKNPQNKPILDSSSMSKILTWDNDQWISYDDEETFTMRRHYAREHCLKGNLELISHQLLKIVCPRCNDLEHRSRNRQ
jgi:chitinase